MWWALAGAADDDVNFTEAQCPSRHEQFKTIRGYGEGESQVMALQKSREDASRRARIALCSPELGASPLCDSRMRQVVSAGDHVKKDRRKYVACTSLAVDYDKIPSLEPQLEALDRELATLGRRVRDVVGDATVWLQGPVYPGGCAVRSTGVRIRQAVAAELASIGKGLPDPALPLVRLLLTITRAQASLSAEIRKPGQRGWVPVRPVTWTSEIMDDKPEDAEQCVDDQALGLPKGERYSPTGLALGIAADPAKTQFCSGEEATLRVRANKAAHVRLVSVTVEGDARQVWPFDGSSDLVTPGSPVELPATMLHTVKGQERVVALGLPVEESWTGPLAGNRFCALPDAFRVADVPAGAAAATWSVNISLDSRVCADPDRFRRQTQLAKEAWNSAPPCP